MAKLSKTIHLKPGVTTVNASDDIIKAANIAESVYRSFGHSLWITSATEGHANDGVHSKNSKHYEGNAIDLRTRNVSGGINALNDICDEIRILLGDDYDVIRESDHIHIEYDPKSVMTKLGRTTERVLTTQRDAVSLIQTIGRIVTTLIPFYNQIKALFKKYSK